MTTTRPARLTSARETEIAAMELPKGRAVIAIAELLDELEAVRAERDEAQRACREQGAPRNYVHKHFHEQVLAAAEARGEQRGRAAGLAAAGEHVLTFQRKLASFAGKRPKQWVDGYLTGIGVAACKIGEVINQELRGGHVPPGTPPADDPDQPA